MEELLEEWKQKIQQVLDDVDEHNRDDDYTLVVDFLTQALEELEALS